MKTDAEILDWLERMHTLHTTVEALYVVDGYLVQLCYDGDAPEVLTFHGETLREAYSKAMVIEYNVQNRQFYETEDRCQWCGAIRNKNGVCPNTPNLNKT